jgi:hypothetical protein
MVADTVGLLVFVTAGVIVHGGRLRASVLVRDVVPLLGVWGALAPLTGVYRAPGWGSLARHWAVSVPVGVLLRQVLLGRPLGRGTLVFLAAAWVFAPACVAAARLAAGLLAPGRSPARRAPAPPAPHPPPHHPQAPPGHLPAPGPRLRSRGERPRGG